MGRNGAVRASAAVVVPVLGAAICCAALSQYYVRSQRVFIQQLSQVSAGSAVHLEGAVIATNPADSQFWIQDKTGTVPVSVKPDRVGVRVGDTIFLDAHVVKAAAERSGSDESAPSKLRSSENRRRTAPPSAARGTGLGDIQSLGDEHLDHLSLADSTSGVRLQVSRIQRYDTRWVLLPSLSLVWLFVLNRRVHQQKGALGHASEDLRKASERTTAIRELTSAVQSLTKEGAFNSEVPVQDDVEVAPLSAEINMMILEIQRRDRSGKEAETRLKQMTLIDDLTGLPNRRLLSDRLSQSITKAQRDQSLFALLHIDLDAFKLVNDRIGHDAGDAVLAKVAQRLRVRFRQSDTLARLGGDEFALILDRIQERSDAQRAAAMVLDALREPFEIEGHSIPITASIGISIFPDGHEYGQLLQQADCAMYAAKRSGKGRIVQYSDDLGSAARERLTLEGALQHAIAKGEISLQYQPEYDLTTNRIVRFEALARWTHPSLGRIGPVSFIPVAEESGLIVSLGAYIMERACMDALAWQEAAQRPIQVAVNVSTVQFSQDSFFEEVAGILHRTGLHPSLLQIELTESATLSGIERATEMMKRLNRMGISVAVDDFGTGYSCLTYLPKLSFDTLKLDRSFVNGLMVRRETRSFVESIITLAHNLHMKVIVEGVETKEQLRLIRSLGADEAQGHLLGQPSADPGLLLIEEVKRKILEDSNARDSVHGVGGFADARL
jgi:diguanylate cyclase (GGDEF)-like protein